MKDLSQARKLGKDIYKYASSGKSSLLDSDELDRDKDGYIILQHTSQLPVTDKTDLVTDLSELEKRLNKFRSDREQEQEKYISSDISNTVLTKNSKSGFSSKPMKKKDRKKLLKGIFSNADKYNLYQETDEDEDEEIKKDTLDTTYGQRYSPIVTMIHEAITDFDHIAEEIEEDLASKIGKTKYRSDQTANLLTAKKSKLDAVKELASIAKQISDLEYKRDKDNAKDDDSNMDKAIIEIGSRYLSGSIDDFADNPSPKRKKSSKKSKQKKSDEDTTDEIQEDVVKQPKRRPGYVSTNLTKSMIKEMNSTNDDSDLSDALGKALMKHKDELEFTPYEKNIGIEGKYTLAIKADADKPSSNWKFIALDRDGKEIKNFKDDYPDLVPKKSDCKMSFDTSKLRVTDKTTSITYKLYLK